MKEGAKKIIEGLKSLGWTILGIAFIAGIILLILFIMEGTVWIGGKVLPFLITVTTIFTLISVFIFVPMTLFKKARKWGGIALYFSSFLFGLTLWIYSALVTYMLWGLIALIIGLFLLGIGVLPFAFLAALFDREWIIIFNLIYIVLLTYGTRVLGLYVLKKTEEENFNLSLDINFCEKCGGKLDEDSKYCTTCGTKTAL